MRYRQLSLRRRKQLLKLHGKRLLNNVLWSLNGCAPPTLSQSTREWVQGNTGCADIVLFGGAGTAPPPASQTLADAPAIDWQPPVDTADNYVARISNGRAARHGGHVITPDNILLGDLSNAPVLELGRLPPIRRVEGRVAVLASTSSRNYYHWMMDVLPRLALIKLSGLHADKYFVRSDMPFQRDTLRKLGIRPDQVIAATRYSHIRADELIVPCRPVALPLAVPFLRQSFCPSLNPSSPAVRIYISRERASKRRVSNEADVMRVLTSYGFAKFNLESLAVADQVNLFANAECVIGPHGAGFCNVIFCRKDTKIIELFDAGNTPLYFYVLCGQLELSHYYLVCTRRGPWPTMPRSDPDMWVDVTQLPRLLDMAGISRVQ